MYQLITNIFNDYCAQHRAFFDYLLLDHIIATAYDHLPAIKQMIDSEQPYQDSAYGLMDIINEHYDEELFSDITTRNAINKLTYKFSPVEDGSTTYHHILRSTIPSS